MKVDKMKKRAEVWMDGAARGNPGKAGIGVVVKDKSGGTLAEEFEYLGDDYTNNQAEYHALLKGLEVCADLDIDEVRVYSDSSLVVNQMRGDFRVRSDNLRPLYERARGLEKEFGEVIYRHISREENSEADALANEAIDERK